MNNLSSSIADLLRHSIILDNSYYNSGGGRQRRTQGGYVGSVPQISKILWFPDGF